MALFSTKKSVIETLLASGWSSEEEKEQLLAKLRASPPRSGAELVPFLWHENGDVRRMGSNLFLQRPDGPAVERFLIELGERPAASRANLLPLIEHLPATEVSRQLSHIVRDGTPDAKRWGWELALNLPGTLGASFLETAVLEAPGPVRLKAMRKLVEGTPDASRLGLLRRLARDEDHQIRLQALEALSHVPGPQVLGLMIERIAEGDSSEQAIAERYLANAEKVDPVAKRNALLEILTRGNQNTRRIVMRSLLGADSAANVVREVLTRGKGMAGWLRNRVLEALREAGDQVLKATLEVIQGDDQELRTSAVMMLADGKPQPMMLGPFCRLLSDPDWWLRVSACEVLGNLGDERAVPYLVRALEDDETRWAAVDALAQIGAASALQPLSKLLRDPREEVRMEVLQAFSRYSDQRLLPVIRSVRDRDPSEAVRERAREVLRDLNQRLNLDEGDEGGSKVDLRRLENPLDKLLWKVREMGASDLHLTVGEPPMVRLDGELQRMEGVGVLSPEHCRRYILGILDEEQRRELQAGHALDFCRDVPEVGRYRANAFQQWRGLCASFRVIPNMPPTFRDLGLPQELKELLDYHQGIIVLAGPSGCGKSSSLVALMDLINETKALHVVTLEDPVEFVHLPKLGLINQRQVGRDTASFASGLRAAMREDPDVIVVGELRDPETIRMALKAAETGHLVLATLHTIGVVQTIDRLVESLPPDEQAQIRSSLSESLKYVVSQRLVPRKNPEAHPPGKRRVAVFEVIKVTFSIGAKIRQGDTFKIPSLMQIGRHLGMKTRDMALMEMVEAELIDPETAWRYAEKPATFQPLCDPSRISAEVNAP